MVKLVVNLQNPRHGLSSADEEVLARAQEGFHAKLAQSRSRFEELSRAQERIAVKSQSPGRDGQTFFPFVTEELLSPENIPKLPEKAQTPVMQMQERQKQITRDDEGLNAAAELISRPTGADILGGVRELPPRGLMHLYAFLEDAADNLVASGSGSPFMRELVNRVRERRWTMSEELDPRTDMNIYDAYAIDEFRRWLAPRFEKERAVAQRRVGEVQDEAAAKGVREAFDKLVERQDAILDVLNTPTRAGIMEKIPKLGERKSQLWRNYLHEAVYVGGIGEVWPGERSSFNRTVLNDMFDLTERIHRTYQLTS